MKRLVIAGTVLAGTLMAGPAVAQPNMNAQPLYGTVTLRSGFTPDPRVVRTQSGGTYNASNLGGNCTGWIGRAPDVRLNYSAGSLPLILSVASSTDTTLVVNGPDGSWYCDDDSGNGNNPSLRWNNAQSGRYEIWIGSYARGGGARAQLHISEVRSQ